MHPRTYACTLAALGATLFVGVVGINLVLDPQGVFGTGLFGRSPNLNNRYERLVAYQAAPQLYDGVLFGSSRARAMPSKELSQRFNVARFADFAVDFGSIADHLPALDYILRKKRERHEPLRAVFLLLDVDMLGFQPATNKFIQTLLPPALTGESTARFWWRNATAIQPEAWQSSVQAAWHSPPTNLDAAPALPGPSSGTAAVAAPTTLPASQATAVAAPEPSDAPAPQPAPRLARPPERIAHSIHFIAQMKLFQRFVALCREHGISPVVATTPLHRAQAALYNPKELEEAVHHISRIVPLWDFSHPNQLSNRPEMWRDYSHFRPEVGHLMLSRIFDETPAAGEKFGRLWHPGRAEVGGP